MKKISIIFAVLAIFMLLASCSNAAGEVDLAGNPVNLTGTWSGTIAYKQAADPDLPMSCIPTISGGKIVGYTDYAGTYVSETSFTPPADYDEIDTYSTSITYKHIFDMDSWITTKTVVVNPDGSFTDTTVTTTTRKARAALLASDGVLYRIHTNTSNLDTYTQVASDAARVAGTSTYTVTNTYSAPVKATDGSDTYNYTVTKKYNYAPTGDFGTTGYSTTDPTTYENETKAQIQNRIDNNVIDNRTVAPTLVPVVWQNDITETITLEVTNDGLYTLTNVVTETQTAAAAAAATETNYAAAERKAGTKTTSTTTTGTIAVWETPATDFYTASTTMALSSGVVTTSVDRTDSFVTGYSNIPTIAKFAGAKEYNIRFLEGKAGRKETAKTRMYVNVSEDLDPAGCIAIFDKAVETEEEEE